MNILRKTLKNEEGAITFQTALILTIIGLLVYVGTVYIPPYMDYYLLKEKLKGEADLAHMYTNEALAKRILREANNSWDMGLKREDFIIDRPYGEIYISFKYIYVFDLFGGRYVKKHIFQYEVQQEVEEGGYLRPE